MKSITPEEKTKIQEFEIFLNSDPLWSFKFHSGGYCHVEVEDFSASEIYLVVKSGVKNDLVDTRYEDKFTLDRETLEIKEG
jgi:hypothetical protein